MHRQSLAVPLRAITFFLGWMALLAPAVSYAQARGIVQGFAMGGRTTMTSRVYPMEAYQEAKVYLFNNATGASVTAERLVVHEMDSAHNQLSNMDDHSYVQ